MMNKRTGIIYLVLVITFLMSVFSACGNQKNDNSTNEDTKADSSETKDIAGTITMVGSTSMEKLSNVVAEAFMEKYPNVTVSTEFIGSSAGVEAVLAGTVNIGNASRSLKDSEKSAGAFENIVAIDGIAVILDKSNTVTSLTKEQLVKIYTGEITNWSDIGGSNQPIVVVGRESGSGTRGAFEELLDIEDICKYSNEINSTGGVFAKVASIPGAIGYVSLDVIDETVIAANIDGIEPTEANIKEGSYLLSRPFVMATLGEISTQSELVQTFFEYMKSDEGKDLVKSIGLITVD
jgi:phosphate transport system substrate-binding protein